MSSANPVQLVRIARLRRFVGIFARGGDRTATAEALVELANAGRAAGLTAEALRRAREAAALLADSEDHEATARALIHLATLCLETGAPDSAVAAAELARDRAARTDETVREELITAAMLVAGIGFGLDGHDQEARELLSEARDRLVASGQPAGAALALVQHGLLDVADELPEGADLCFAYARDFYRVAQLPLAAIEVAAVAARAYAETGPWAAAHHWFVTAIAEADVGEAHVLAAELVADLAHALEEIDQPAEALRLATEAARRCADLGGDNAALQMRVRLQLARLAADPKDALRHVESVFELALARREADALGAALEVVVSGIVKSRFAPETWRLVQRFHDHLAAAGLEALATTAETALADLRK